MGKGRREQGLTLVELLAGLAIVGVLVVLVVPSILAHRVSAWQVMSTNNLRQITVANMAYAADNGVFVPVDDWWNNRRWCGARLAGQPYDPAKGLLAEYLGQSRRVTPCPLFTQMMRKQGVVSSFEEGSGGYGYNDYVGGGIAPNYTNDAQRLRISLRMARLTHPSTTIMFATTALARSDGVQEYPFCHPPYWTDEYGVPQPFYGRPSPSLHFRFKGRALVSWCDGHVTAEAMEARPAGYNPYGGDSDREKLGWFGPDRDNGYWNPDFRP